MHAHISSPVAALFSNLQVSMSSKSEFYSLIDDATRLRILRGIFDGYYAEKSQTKLIIDTNRTWTAKVAALQHLYPSAKLICCVRPLAWIADSFERLVRENPLEPSKIYNFSAAGNVFTRTDHLNGPRGVVGFPYHSLKEAFFGPFADALVVLPYEVLVNRPRFAIDELYRALGLPPFAHDFENVEIEADEFDRGLGANGLHTVRRRVAPSSRRLSLPPDLVNRFQHSQFWADPQLNTRGAYVIGVSPPKEPDDAGAGLDSDPTTRERSDGY